MTGAFAERRLASAALVLATLLYAGLLYLGSRRPPSFELDRFDPSDALFLTAVYMFAVMGALVAAKRPGHRMGSIFLATGLLAMLSYGSFEYSVAAVYGPASLPLGGEMTWFGMWGWVPMTGGICLVLLTYPTGRLLSRPWSAPLALVTIATILAFTGSLGFWDHRGSLLLEVTTLESMPRLAGVPSWSHALVAAASPIALLAILLSIVSVIARFRRSRGEERQQMKGLFLAALIMIFGGLMDAVSTALVGPDSVSTFDVLAPLGLLAVPIGTGIAVLRYRLYDIDLVINRTIVYVLLTGVLAVTYLSLVVVIQRLLGPLTRESDVAIAGSTLAVAALFRPLRTRIQAFIDRRFNRRKYDAQQTLESFSARLRDEVDLQHLTKDLTVVVRDTMEPAHVSVWLKAARS